MLNRMNRHRTFLNNSLLNPNLMSSVIVANHRHINMLRSSLILTIITLTLSTLSMRTDLNRQRPGTTRRQFSPQNSRSQMISIMLINQHRVPMPANPHLFMKINRSSRLRFNPNMHYRPNINRPNRLNFRSLTKTNSSVNTILPRSINLRRNYPQVP